MYETIIFFIYLQVSYSYIPLALISKGKQNQIQVTRVIYQAHKKKTKKIFYNNLIFQTQYYDYDAIKYHVQTEYIT